MMVRMSYHRTSPMKLRQTEYCHDCNKHVEFVFDDVPGRQLIICPNCSHQHFREIDGDTIIKIRFNGQREMLFAEPLDLSLDARWNGNDFIEPSPLKVIKKKVLGVDQEGNAVLENNSENLKVTDRRWGRDPRQLG